MLRMKRMKEIPIKCDILYDFVSVAIHKLTWLICTVSFVRAVFMTKRMVTLAIHKLTWSISAVSFV